MPITFVCDQCGESYQVENALAGKAVRCRNCNDLGRVPQAKEAATKKEAAPSPHSQKVASPSVHAEPEPWYYGITDTLAGYMIMLNIIGWTAFCIVLKDVSVKASYESALKQATFGSGETGPSASPWSVAWPSRR